MANTLHAGSHAFICGIGLLPVPAGSSHPYLIPARTHARIESPLCMLDPAHAWTRSTHARSPCVHALGPHACTHARRMTMRARTGSPRTNACTQDSHACTHRVPTHARRTPMRARTRSPRTNARTQDPHACTHQVPTHARRIPMRTRTGSPCTCMHSTDPLPVHAGSPHLCQTPMCVRTRRIPACMHAPGLTTHAGMLDSHACTHQVITHARTPGPCMHSVFWDCSCSTVDIYVVDRILIKASLTQYMGTLTWLNC